MKKEVAIPLLTSSSFLVAFGIIAAAPPIGLALLPQICLLSSGILGAGYASYRGLGCKGGTAMFLLTMGFAVAGAGLLSLIPSFGLASPVNLILILAGFTTILLALGAVCYSKYSSSSIAYVTPFPSSRNQTVSTSNTFSPSYT